MKTFREFISEENPAKAGAEAAKRDDEDRDAALKAGKKMTAKYTGKHSSKWFDKNVYKK